MLEATVKGWGRAHARRLLRVGIGGIRTDLARSMRVAFEVILEGGADGVRSAREGLALTVLEVTASDGAVRIQRDRRVGHRV